MWIDTKIVFEPGRKLALAYNRAMESTTAEWVLFLDQDLYLANPRWYQMSLDAVKSLCNEKVGWITAKTNRIGNKRQLHTVEDDSDDLNQHIEIASELYKKRGNDIAKVGGNLSGFFILTNKTAWKSVGGFKDQGKGLSAIDKTYSKDLQTNGFGLYVMEGLYLYHFYKKRKKELYSKF